MNHLVLGCGEVGAALREILQCEGYDARLGILAQRSHYDMLHICIPHSSRFVGSVMEARFAFTPRYIVIHSTVPVGTSDRLVAHHSPVRGRHPQLAESMRTFVKYVGGPQSAEIADELRAFGIPAEPVASARDTEAGKLLDLMQFGAAVLLEKEIYHFCEVNHLDFDVVYRKFNETYNDGYAHIGQPQFRRPILAHVDGPIGGHCVAQNMGMLTLETAARIADFNMDAVRGENEWLIQ